MSACLSVCLSIYLSSSSLCFPLLFLSPLLQVHFSVYEYFLCVRYIYIITALTYSFFTMFVCVYLPIYPCMLMYIHLFDLGKPVFLSFISSDHMSGVLLYHKGFTRPTLFIIATSINLHDLTIGWVLQHSVCIGTHTRLP